MLVSLVMREDSLMFDVNLLIDSSIFDGELFIDGKMINHMTFFHCVLSTVSSISVDA